MAKTGKPKGKIQSSYRFDSTKEKEALNIWYSMFSEILQNEKKAKYFKYCRLK